MMPTMKSCLLHVVATANSVNQCVVCFHSLLMLAFFFFFTSSPYPLLRHPFSSRVSASIYFVCCRSPASSLFVSSSSSSCSCSSSCSGCTRCGHHERERERDAPLSTSCTIGDNKRGHHSSCALYARIDDNSKAGYDDDDDDSGGSASRVKGV